MEKKSLVESFTFPLFFFMFPLPFQVQYSLPFLQEVFYSHLLWWSWRTGGRPPVHTAVSLPSKLSALYLPSYSTSPTVFATKIEKGGRKRKGNQLIKNDLGEDKSHWWKSSEVINRNHQAMILLYCMRKKNPTFLSVPFPLLSFVFRIHQYCHSLLQTAS